MKKLIVNKAQMDTKMTLRKFEQAKIRFLNQQEMGLNYKALIDQINFGLYSYETILNNTGH